jgi:hypothetical protein
MNFVHSQVASGSLESLVTAYPVVVPCVPRWPEGPLGSRVAFHLKALVLDDGKRNSATRDGVA